MARGRVLGSREKNMIAQVYLDHPNWHGTRIRAEVLKAIEAADGPDVDALWPSLSAIQKQLRAFRDAQQRRGSHPDDRPWSLLALGHCDIPSAAVPTIVTAWASSVEAGQPITIREAKWIGRLFCLWTDEALLQAAAKRCAEQERVVDLSGAYPETAEDARRFWSIDYAAFRQQQDAPNADDRDPQGTVADRRRAFREAHERELGKGDPSPEMVGQMHAAPLSEDRGSTMAAPAAGAVSRGSASEQRSSSLKSPGDGNAHKGRRRKNVG